METAGRTPAERAASLLERVRRAKPLVHHITNVVVANLTANATLAAGALPVMAHAIEEAADMAGAADALVLNMGTPTTATVEAMVAAGRAANAKGIPVVFDPVGAGATPFRDRTAATILRQVNVTLVRGNSAEIAFLAGIRAEIRGVEATAATVGQGLAPAELAPLAAARLQTVVAVTGPRDYVGDGRRLAVVDNGHPMMARITGSGCTATAIVAAFCAVEPDAVVAAASALAYLGAAGELAAAASRGPGSFQVNWLDELANLTPAKLAELAAISWKE